MSLLEMKNIKKSFGDTEVLKDISLTVDTGEVLGIIGPSGSGKSTLLRCATNLESPDSGEIRYEGTFGLVFQNFNLFPHYSVMKNIIDAPLKVQKRKKEEVVAEARKLLGKMGLEGKEDAYPYQLSGGQQQRVSIARALAGSPSLILADEPTGALDSKTSRDVLGFLKQLNDEGNTIVMITHDNAIAMEARRVVRIKDGQINFDGDVKDYAAII